MSILTKITGYGNNITTYLTNLDEVANELKRNPIEIIKYISYELGTIINKNNELRGQISCQEINKILDSYKRDFVICVNCNTNGITKYNVKNDGKIYQKCLNCNSEFVNNIEHKIKLHIYDTVPVDLS
jgi:translation initiation factor 2 beta subunit (eIF-2beta)/eIF-5